MYLKRIIKCYLLIDDCLELTRHVMYILKQPKEMSCTILCLNDLQNPIIIEEENPCSSMICRCELYKVNPYTNKKRQDLHCASVTQYVQSTKHKTNQLQFLWQNYVTLLYLHWKLLYIIIIRHTVYQCYVALYFTSSSLITSTVRTFWHCVHSEWLCVNTY